MTPPDLRLLLSNRPQNVALVRQALGGLAGAVGLDDGLLADVKTAVSEACNNVVLHAYPGGEGPLEVYVCPDGTQLEIVVSVDQTLAGPVLSSVIAVLAARAGFSIERLSDAQLITDAIAAHAAGTFEGTRVNTAIEAGDRELELNLAPLVDGGGNALVTASAVGGLEPVLERLSDELVVEPVDGAERLRLRIVDRR